MFGVAVVAWLAGGSLPLVAITCGAVMVAIAQRDPAFAIERVDWDLLLLFAALFVVMQGLNRTGAVEQLDQAALALVHPDSPMRTSVAVSGAMLVLSNLISNVPAVLLWRHTVDVTGPRSRLASPRHELDIRREFPAHRLRGKSHRG
jgi:Na+/H+ antiporter NhaD/arsenite permease-like protein